MTTSRGTGTEEVSDGATVERERDPVVALLVATAVGFVEAGMAAGTVSRLRDLAGGDADTLTRARASVDAWRHVSPDTRARAVRMLTVASVADASGTGNRPVHATGHQVALP